VWRGVTQKLSHHSLSVNNIVLMVKCTTQSASWDEGDEEILLEFLETSLPSAGDGVNFKQATWNATAEHMIPFNTRGGVKTAKACKNKFSRVCTTSPPLSL
jgi:hypothetical protein